MMKKFKIFITVALVSLVIISCDTKYEKKSYYDTGELKEKYVFPTEQDYNTNLNYTGYQFYKNGKLKTITTIKNGEREGNYVEYFPEGKLGRIRTFHKGKKNGTDKFYSKTGELVEEGFYLNDIHLMQMKAYYIEGQLVNFFYDVEQDTLVENGRLVFDKDGKIVIDESFYFYTSGKDSIYLGEDYNLEVTTYTLGKNNRIKEIVFGEFDTNYNFVDTSKLVRLISETNRISYTFKPNKEGVNLVLGKIYVESDFYEKGEKETLTREFIFYKDFYVLPK